MASSSYENKLGPHMPLIPVGPGMKVVLSMAGEEPAAQRAKKSLMIVPDQTAWNDFGNNFRAQLHFVGFGQAYAPIDMRLSFPGVAKSRLAVADILGGESQIRLSDVDQSFVTMLADTDSYRILVERLGFADAFGSLRKMHDAVVARLEANDGQTLELTRNADFVQGVLRNNATWNAYRQGGRYLSPYRLPDVEDAAHSFSVHLKLHGMPGDYELDADFGDDFPLSRRTLVLVGENGVGKTRFLRALIDGVQTAPPWDVQTEKSSIFDTAPRFSRLLAFSSAASDPYPSHLPPWTGVDYRFHRMTGQYLGDVDNLAQSLLDCMRSEDEPVGRRGLTRMQFLDEVLQVLGIKESLYVEVTPTDEHSELLPVPIRVGDRLYLPFFGLNGEQRRLQLQARMISEAAPVVLMERKRSRDLSSGEQALLRFAAQAVGSVRSGTMFLFDEPETHLHPRYVSTFMSILDRLLEWSGSIALIATHSAFVVREVPSRRVRIVRRDEAEGIMIAPPRLQTFGASIDMISQFVFGDVQLKHRFQEVLDAWLAKPGRKTISQFREEFGEDLNAETLSYMAQMLAERERQ